jgi:hypothetical protein
MSQSRSWVFTINNPDAEDWKRLSELNVRRIIAAEETGKCGTVHIQGAVIFKKPFRFQRTKEALGSNAHIEQMLGSWKQNVTYCSKDSKVIIHEDNSQQGCRSDLLEFQGAIDDGAGDAELYRSFPSIMARYHRYAGGYRNAVCEEQGQEFRNVEVHVLWGEGGKGKSRKALYNDDGTSNGAFLVPWTRNLKWWDGYKGQKTIVLDEFDPAELDLKFDKWKRLCDGHRMQVEVKGGFTWACWETIYICSNKDPACWWGGAFYDSVEFQRRITSIDRFE